MAKAKKEMSNKLRGTTDHDLYELVGKKIKEITMYKVSIPSSADAKRFYRIKVAGRGENDFILGCETAPGQQPRISLMYPDDFETMIDDLVSEVQQNLEPDVDDEDDDADLEPDEDESMPANLFDRIESEDDEDEDPDAESDEDEDDGY
jgi:hypothetical protein